MLIYWRVVGLDSYVSGWCDDTITIHNPELSVLSWGVAQIIQSSWSHDFVFWNNMKEPWWRLGIPRWRHFGNHDLCLKHWWLVSRESWWEDVCGDDWGFPDYHDLGNQHILGIYHGFNHHIPWFLRLVHARSMSPSARFPPPSTSRCAFGTWTPGRCWRRQGEAAGYGELYLVGGFGTFFIFPYIGNFIIPSDFHIFQRGRYTTNQLWTWNKDFYITTWIMRTSKSNISALFQASSIIITYGYYY